MCFIALAQISPPNNHSLKCDFVEQPECMAKENRAVAIEFLGVARRERPSWRQASTRNVEAI